MLLHRIDINRFCKHYINELIKGLSFHPDIQKVIRYQNCEKTTKLVYELVRQFAPIYRKNNYLQWQRVYSISNLWSVSYVRIDELSDILYRIFNIMNTDNEFHTKMQKLDIEVYELYFCVALKFDINKKILPNIRNTDIIPTHAGCSQ